MMNGKAVFVAVMGVTGAGKSTFIRLAAGRDDIKIGHDLRSCTSQVAAYSFKHGPYDVYLVDTPGFNDTTRSETEVLKEIADWLEITYREPRHIKLSGIIYLQSIGDTKMYGSTMRNLKMFRQLVGDQPLKNVVLATTFWDKEDPARAKERERELGTDPAFWQPMIKKGSRLERVTDRGSALRIIESLIDLDPVTLAIQDELINQHKVLSDTSAGKTVNEELARLAKIHEAEMTALRKEMKDAIAERDVELQESIAAAAAAHERAIDKIQRDQESLRYERRSEQRRHQQELDETQSMISAIQKEREEERREHDMRLQAQKVESEMHFEAIVARLKENEGKVRAEERQFLQAQIQEAQAQAAQSHSLTGSGTKLLVSIASVVGSVAMTALGFPMILGNPLSGLADFFNQIN